MEAFVVIALVGIGLLAAELLLPTGGLLAALGVAGLVAGGILALGSSDSAAEYVGGALIALAVLCAASFLYVSRKVIRSTWHLPKRAGTEEMIGGEAEARSTIDPTGRVFMRGTLWSARLAAGVSPIGPGDRVKVEAVDGLTLVVSPAAPQVPSSGSATPRSEQGASRVSVRKH